MSNIRTPRGRSRCRRVAAEVAFLSALGVVLPSLAEEKLPVEYPDTGVEIGQGWDTQKVSSLASGGSCIHYSVAHSQPGQAVSVKLSEVSDREQLMRAISVSADFSVKSLVSKVSGRSSFAHDQQLSSVWSSFAAQALVDNGFLVAAGPPVAAAAAKEYGSVLADPKAAQSAKLFGEALQKSTNLSPRAIGLELAGRIPDAASPSFAVRLSALTLEAVNRGVVRKKGAAAPAPRAAGGLKAAGGDEEMDAFPGMIVLKKQYKALAQANPGQFRRVCGDSFVFAIREGAELDALVTFQTTSQAEQMELSAAARGAGASFSASGSFAEKMQQYEQKKALNITFVKTGGRSDPVASDRAGINAAINQLAASAANAPYRYSFMTVPYDQLPNWPRDDVDEIDASRFTDLARAYGKWQTLWQDVTLILNNTAESAPGSTPDAFLIGRTGASYADLATIQATALTNKTNIEAMASTCTAATGVAGKNACTVPAGADASDMPHRAKLPLPVAVPAAPLEALESDAELKTRVADYWIKRVNNGRCSFASTPGYCLQQTEVSSYASQVPVQPRAIVFYGYQDGCLSTNGPNVRLNYAGCDLKQPIPASHKWQYDKSKRAIYQTIGGKPYCFDVNGGDTRNNAAVLGFACHYGRNQRFSIVLADTNDAAHIVGDASGRCVDVDGEAKIWDCHKQDQRKVVDETQKWRLVLVAP